MGQELHNGYLMVTDSNSALSAVGQMVLQERLLLLHISTARRVHYGAARKARNHLARIAAIVYGDDLGNMGFDENGSAIEMTMTQCISCGIDPLSVLEDSGHSAFTLVRTEDGVSTAVDNHPLSVAEYYLKQGDKKEANRYINMYRTDPLQGSDPHCVRNICAAPNGVFSVNANRPVDLEDYGIDTIRSVHPAYNAYLHWYDTGTLRGALSLDSNLFGGGYTGSFIAFKNAVNLGCDKATIRSVAGSNLIQAHRRHVGARGKQGSMTTAKYIVYMLSLADEAAAEVFMERVCIYKGVLSRVLMTRASVDEGRMILALRAVARNPNNLISQMSMANIGRPITADEICAVRGKGMLEVLRGLPFWAIKPIVESPEGLTKVKAHLTRFLEAANLGKLAECLVDHPARKLNDGVFTEDLIDWSGTHTRVLRGRRLLADAKGRVLEAFGGDPHIAFLAWVTVANMGRMMCPLPRITHHPSWNRANSIIKEVYSLGGGTESPSLKVLPELTPPT